LFLEIEFKLNSITNLNKKNMKDLNKNYADELLKNGNAKITTEDHFEEMLCCLPPQLTNFTKEKGFNAFLVGEPYSHRFCEIAKDFVPVFECFAKTSDGFYLRVDYMSEANFTKLFINFK